MKKYRVSYPYIFNSSQSFFYKNELIGGVEIDILFKIYGENGNEIFTNEGEELYFELGNTSIAAPHFLDVFFDEKELYCFVLNGTLIKSVTDVSKVEIEVVNYYKDIDKGIHYPERISQEEFLDIFKSNMHYFNTSDNFPTQTISYGTVPA